ncbi:MAG: cell wall-binding repeat-containing protein [Coriobacteriia bacterium]|nr:cell wall-binding repeat-containing protein [Coriobacteriia bacterium]
MPAILTRPASLPGAAASAIELLGIGDVTVPGSTAAVSAAAEAEVRALGPRPAVRRLGGAGRYATAQRIAGHAFEGSLATKGFIGVATGLNFPDALAGGAAAGERGGVLVLTAPDAPSGNWAGYLPGAYAGTKPDIQLYGGSNVLSDNVFNTLKEMLID